jgi:5-methylcytosine-specific restriction protein A
MIESLNDNSYRGAGFGADVSRLQTDLLPMVSRSILRPCHKPGCSELVSNEKPCTKHPTTRYLYRDPVHKQGYTYRWNQYAKRYLRQHPLCVEGTKAGRIEAAEVVDHITPITNSDDPGFWNPLNHQALCKSCHSRKTLRDQAHGLTRAPKLQP